MTASRMTDSRAVQVFATNNDTDDWIVIADNRFQAFGTEDEALAIKDKLLDIDADDCPPLFGAIEVIQPRHCRKGLAWGGRERSVISKCTESDLLLLAREREKKLRSGAAISLEEWCDMGIMSRIEKEDATENPSYQVNMKNLQNWSDGATLVSE